MRRMGKGLGVFAVLLAVVALAAAPAGAKTRTLKIKGGTTTLVPSQGALDALTALGITPSAIAPGTLGSGGFAFPVTRSRISAKDYSGTIRHAGGIRLTKGATVVELTRFWINVDAEPDLTARLGGDRVSILDLDLSGATITRSKKVLTVAGVKATLTAGAAQALNGAFGSSAFTEGLELGTATVKARYTRGQGPK
jgi:hypothetical protein